jgi:carbon monoxide dehydrogenase subunit G
MAKIAVEADYAASAAKVWERLGDFGGIGSWMPGVANCEVAGSGVGATRTISMGPMKVVERLESFDPAARRLSYSIVEGPMPTRDYLATIEVRETAPGRCHVDWTASFELPPGLGEEQVRGALQGAYGGALKALRPLVES